MVNLRVTLYLFVKFTVIYTVSSFKNKLNNINKILLFIIMKAEKPPNDGQCTLKYIQVICW